VERGSTSRDDKEHNEIREGHARPHVDTHTRNVLVTCGSLALGKVQHVRIDAPVKDPIRRLGVFLEIRSGVVQINLAIPPQAPPGPFLLPIRALMAGHSVTSQVGATIVVK